MDRDRAQLFGQIDVVREQIGRAATAVANGEAESFHEYVAATLDTDWCPPLESPLEAVFWIWWQSVCGPTRASYREFTLRTQQEVIVAGQRFRLDFVVELGEPLARVDARAWKPIAIEVDGHAFHEKTPEQVAYRNRRDRLLQQAGWTVFHFSWTELTTRGEDCAAEVLVAARRQYEAIFRSRFKATE